MLITCSLLHTVIFYTVIIISTFPVLFPTICFPQIYTLATRDKGHSPNITFLLRLHEPSFLFCLSTPMSSPPESLPPATSTVDTTSPQPCHSSIYTMIKALTPLCLQLQLTICLTAPSPRKWEQPAQLTLQMASFLNYS